MTWSTKFLLEATALILCIGSVCGRNFLKKDEIGENDCFCICTKIWDPVCGCDGKTYSNFCTFECAQCEHPELQLKVSHEGSCIFEANQVTSNKYTCSNKRSNDHPVINVPAKKQDISPKLEKITNFPLSKSSLDCTYCSCTKNLDPVCTTDGRIFDNLCKFKCARCKNPALEIQPCPPDVFYNNLVNLEIGQSKEKLTKVPKIKYRNRCGSSKSECHCLEPTRTICGTDGFSYRNQCALECAMCTSPGLGKKHDGRCN